jgi:hypothetical protein
MEIEGHNESITRRHPPGLHPPGFKYNEEIDKYGGNDITDSNGKGNVMSFDFSSKFLCVCKLVGECSDLGSLRYIILDSGAPLMIGAI